MASLFFIIQNQQARIVAAGRHSKATSANPRPTNQYDILWTHDGLKDSQIKTGKKLTLPRQKH